MEAPYLPCGALREPPGDPTKDDIVQAFFQSTNSYGVLAWEKESVAFGGLVSRWEMLAKGSFADCQVLAEILAEKSGQTCYVAQLEAGAGYYEMPRLAEAYDADGKCRTFGGV